jgi:acyl carrier protein
MGSNGADPAAIRAWMLDRFREAIGVPVDPDEDWFDAGGDSIAALRLVERIQEEYGVPLSVRRFFERPTAADLAAAVLHLRAES